MSLFDYNQSKKIIAEDYSFKALVMAAIRKADTKNYSTLFIAFPDIARELTGRYNSPRGLLCGEQDSEYIREADGTLVKIDEDPLRY